jgi:uncharacterized protein
MSCSVSDLTINISRLSEGTHQYDLEIEPENLELDAGFVGRVLVHATIEKTSNQLRLRADLEAKCQFTCDRCLDEFEQGLLTRFEIVYITEEEIAQRGSDGEVQYISPDKTILDIGEDVRQFLILAVPQKLLCNDDCRGLCTVCGSNRNRVNCKCADKEADPRWEVLKKVSLN